MTTDNGNEWVGVILAAGAGSRMRSSIPKPLHTLCGRTLLGQTMRVLRDAGLKQIVIVASPMIAADPQFIEVAGEDVTVAIQAEPRGTGDALLSASDATTGATQMLVANADMPLITDSTVQAMLSKHTSTGAAVTLLTGQGQVPSGFGRVRRDEHGNVAEIIEEKDADDAALELEEFNAGYYCMDTGLTWSLLAGLTPAANGEIYITDVASAAVSSGAVVRALVVDDLDEVSGVNDRTELAAAEEVLRDRIRRRWMLEGVSMIDPATTYIDSDVVIGQDTTIRPNTHLQGSTRIGMNAEIGPGSVIEDSELADDVRVVSSHLESARVGERVTVGPYSHLRPGAVIGPDAHIGNYAEVKNAVVGSGAKIGHFSYVGDATVGADANIGAGTVTCNYDGDEKHHTVIGANAFIGSGTMLVAPVSIGPNARTGAGAVVTHDVAPGETVVGVPARSMADAD